MMDMVGIEFGAMRDNRGTEDQQQERKKDNNISNVSLLGPATWHTGHQLE